MRLDLRQQHVHEHHVARRGGLGQHHQVDTIAGAFDHLHEIAVGVGRVGGVDADDARAGAELDASAARAPHARGLAAFSAGTTASSRSRHTASAALAAALGIMSGREAGTKSMLRTNRAGAVGHGLRAAAASSALAIDSRLRIA